MKVEASRRWILGVALVLASIPTMARATPSTQIWIPSTDIQKFGVFHLNTDIYARPTQSAVLWLGPTVGVLPWEKIQAEVGFDLIFQNVRALDEHPLYFHGKLATPEDSMFKWSPAIAVGMYNIGIKPGLTTQNLAYGLVARTLPYLGRFSVGYFYGNEAVVVDENGNPANHGFLASWDRTMTEISDKLWLCVDYQGSRSTLGAVNFGFSWAFTPSFSVLVGWDHYIYGSNFKLKDTFTIQLDINVDPFH